MQEKVTRYELKKRGFSGNDIAEILLGLKRSTYFLLNSNTEKEISESDAIRILGREEWLKGICVSSFTSSSTRWGLNHERVRIHTQNYIA